MLLCMALLGQMGLGASWNTSGTMVYNPNLDEGWYDADNHQVVLGNGSFAGENGTMGLHLDIPDGIGESRGNVTWTNATGSYVCYQVTGEQATQANWGFNFSLGTSLGFIALVVGIIVFAGIIGTKVLGSTAGGGNDTSSAMILKGTFFLGLWGILSALAITLITAVDVLGPIFYIILTLLYCVGIVGQVGNGGGD